jgi:hypothetical protein
MKALMDSMLTYWMILLVFSLGVAALIYKFWLSDVIM